MGIRNNFTEKIGKDGVRRVRVRFRDTLSSPSPSIFDISTFRYFYISTIFNSTFLHSTFVYFYLDIFIFRYFHLSTFFLFDQSWDYPLKYHVQARFKYHLDENYRLLSLFQVSQWDDRPKAMIVMVLVHELHYQSILFLTPVSKWIDH